MTNNDCPYCGYENFRLVKWHWCVYDVADIEADITAWLENTPKIPDADTGADGNNNQHPQGTTNNGI